MTDAQLVFDSENNTVFYIAEIGGNHEGDYAYALELAHLAVESGADAVKFQLYEGDKLVSPIESPDRNTHFKAFELKRADYIKLAEFCIENSVEFMASVWDTEALTWIDPYITYHKVGSGDLTCYPLLAAFVETGKPLILSTGLAELSEIEASVEFINSIDSTYMSQKKLALLQCTSAYPTPVEDANVMAMLSLKDAFGLPVGYSDHTEGSDAIELASALGASIIEKHFTDSRINKTFRDHLVSLTKDEVRLFLAKAKRFKTLRGEKRKYLTPSERKDKHELSFRRSVYASKNIREGDRFTENNLTVLRPKNGICASHFYKILGQQATRDIKRFEVLTYSDAKINS